MTEMEFEAKVDVIDRSALELYAVCPAQARFAETGVVKAVGREALVGAAVHDALSRAVQTYVELQGQVRITDVANEVTWALQESRPDVQPGAIASVRSSIWAWASFLNDIHWTNILRFDGGSGVRSGQLSWDIDRLGVRATSEIDLLCATASPEVVQEFDWKTGHKYWTEQTVRESFQFQMHAWLIFQNYPDVQCVRTSIWNTRVNRRTYAVEFTREKLADYQSRVMMALQYRHLNRNVAPEKAEVWPSADGCPICAARALCPAADRDIKTEPPEMLRQLIAVEARGERLKEMLSAHVDATGEDVVCNGAAFGTEKPKAARKPTKSLYLRKDDDVEA